MGCLVAILLFSLPILEIYIFITVSQYIGYLASLSSIFFSGLLGFLVLRSVFHTLVSYKIQDFGSLQLRTRDGILIVLGLGLFVPGYISDLAGVFFLLFSTTSFVGSYIRSTTNFHFSSLSKNRVSNLDSELLQEKSKDTIIEGDYVNLSDIPDNNKDKD